MKTDITGRLVGSFNTPNTQINTTVFNVPFRPTFMLPEGSNEQEKKKKQLVWRKKGAEERRKGRSRRRKNGPQSARINEVV